MIQNNNDTIVATATARGKGGVGIVRVSGIDVSRYMLGLIPSQESPF